MTTHDRPAGLARCPSRPGSVLSTPSPPRGSRVEDGDPTFGDAGDRFLPAHPSWGRWRRCVDSRRRRGPRGRPTLPLDGPYGRAAVVCEHAGGMAFLEPILWPLVVAALVVLALLAVLYRAQRSLLYFPGSAAPDADLLPVPGGTVELRTDDGLRLPAWFVAAAGTRGDEPVPGPAVLVCNGNAGDRSHRLPLAVALSERGYHVLLFDYRGYAGNPGRPTEDGLRADARAAAAALAARPEVDPARIAY